MAVSMRQKAKPSAAAAAAAALTQGSCRLSITIVGIVAEYCQGCGAIRM